MEAALLPRCRAATCDSPSSPLGFGTRRWRRVVAVLASDTANEEHGSSTHPAWKWGARLGVRGEGRKNARKTVRDLGSCCWFYRRHPPGHIQTAMSTCTARHVVKYSQCTRFPCHSNAEKKLVGYFTPLLWWQPLPVQAAWLLLEQGCGQHKSQTRWKSGVNPK